MKKKILMILPVVSWGMTMFADAGEYRSFRDYAPVLNVEPIVETSYQPVTRTVCDDRNVQTQNEAPLAPTIGEDIRLQIRLSRDQHACRTVAERRQRQRITGYRVTYRYGGQTSTARYSYDPGERIPVDISLSPLP